MERISSSNTFFLKKVFPVLWFGFLGFFGLLLIPTGQKAGPAAVVPLLFMAVVGFVLMKKVVWDLVDEVYDCGDFLVVKNGADQDNIALSNIMNISASTMTNPPRITLRLVNPSKFGSEICFSPVKKLTLNPFARDPISEDLIQRVDQARVKRMG